MYYPLRSRYIRLSNEKLVLKVIFDSKRASQSQVVRQTGLKAPTVFRIFAKLEKSGFIQPCQNGRPEEAGDAVRKGRKPSYYCIRPESGYAVGLDFWRLGAAVIVVDLRNQVIHHEHAEFDSAPDRDRILQRTETLIHRALQRTGVEPDQLIGIGLAAPGVVDTASGRVLEYVRISGLSGFSLKEHFENAFGVPVYVQNNASVIASSACRYGVARAEKSLLAVLVRFGVGGALVTDRGIFLNGTQTALEIGRTMLCVESYEHLAANASVLESIVAEQPLLQRIRERYPVESWAAVQESLTAAEVGDALEKELLYFATTIYNLNHTFSPDAMLIISRFEILSEVLGEAARKAVPQRRIIPTVYDPVQACYGATDIVFQEFFRVAAGGDGSE